MDISFISNMILDLRDNSTQTSNRKDSSAFSDELKASLARQSETAKQPEQKPIEYIVKKGDSLWKIGRKIFNVDPMQIARDNGITDINMIKPGQKLVINPSTSQGGQANLSGEVTASWYGAEHHRKRTASGQRFNMNGNTLAHKTLPFGTKVRLVNPDNGKVAEGVVNDRGPYIKNRDVDVSYAMAKQLGFVKKGVTKLNIETIKSIKS